VEAIFVAFASIVGVVGALCYQFARLNTSDTKNRWLLTVLYTLLSFCGIFRTIRGCLLLVHYDNVMLMNVLYFFPVLFFFTAYTIILVIWASLLISCCFKNFVRWIRRAQIVAVTFNVLLYIGNIVGIIIDPHFVQVTGIMIAMVLLSFFGLAFLLLGKKIEAKIISSSDVAPEEVKRKRIANQRVTSRTLVLSATTLSYMMVALATNVTALKHPGIQFLIGRQVIFRAYDVLNVLIMLYVVHKDKKEWEGRKRGGSVSSLSTSSNTNQSFRNSANLSDLGKSITPANFSPS